MNFKGKAKRLDDVDLPRLGALIGVGEDEIHAVLDVESRGSGFDNQGRPKMLFEPHLFYRNLTTLIDRARAVHEGLAYPTWRPGNYPSDSYPRLEAAMRIDETAALKSASWGLGQVLGENHKAVGYATPQEMVADLLDDEENHLKQMIKFIQANHLDAALRSHNWSAFARGYNGPQYAVHNYHGRLAAAYSRWKGIRDTPWSPSDAVAESETHEQVVSYETVKWAQTTLNELGADPPLAVDGDFGPLTEAMVRRYQAEKGLLVTGTLDSATIERLGQNLDSIPKSTGLVAWLRRLFT